MIELKKLKQRIFFLKVWAKNGGAHHTWQNTVSTLSVAQVVYSINNCCLIFGVPCQLHRPIWQLRDPLNW